jgi:hypothetical protein
MAHPYKDEADKGHEKKLKSYGKDDKALGSKEKAKNWAGFDALNTNEQAGMRPLNKSASMSEDTADRIMRKAGGKVSGAMSLKRLDKAPRKGKAAGGEMKGTGQRTGDIPSPQTQQEDYDPQLRGKGGKMAPGTVRKHGGKIQDYEARSDDSQGVSGKPVRHSHAKGGSAYHEGHMSKGQKYGAARTAGETKGELDSAMRAMKYGNKAKAEKELGRAQGHTRKTEYYTGRAKGGKADHPDEAEDKALIRKMVKKEDLKMKDGGRAKRASGGGAFSDYMGGSESGSKSGGKKASGKTTVNIMVGGQQPQMPPPNPMALAALLGAAKGGPGAPPPPAPPPGGMPPAAPGMAPPMMAAPPPQMPPPGPGAGPMPRKDGGSVQVPYKKPGRKGEYPDMDFGSGGGFGRKQKIDAYGDKQKS